MKCRTILIIDDNPSILTALKICLGDTFENILTLSHPDTAPGLLQQEQECDIAKLVAQREVESWQRLTRVLTHEIMNATAPISGICQAYLSNQKIQGTPYEEGIKAIYDTSNLPTLHKRCLYHSLRPRQQARASASPSPARC